MIYLPLQMLKPGMVLARDIPSSNMSLQLMVAGQTFTHDSIALIEARGIQGVYIESPLAEGIEAPPIIEPKLKQELLGGIKAEFQKSLVKNTEPSYKAVSAMATSIVMSILNQDEFLFNVIDIRDYDNYTYSHSLYVGMLSVLIGSRLNLPTTMLTDLAASGLLHDIGKLDVPLDITNKPGPLSLEEFEIMKGHPAKGIQRLKGTAPYRSAVFQGIECHHETFDGCGYPHGLAGERIPLFGRILAIADVYDALSSTRSYRKSWQPHQIIDYLTSRAGTQFDPVILQAFLHAVAAFPTGTLVRLSDGAIGIVTKNNADFILRPKVRLLLPKEQEMVEIDLSKEHYNVTILDTITTDTDGLL